MNDYLHKNPSEELTINLDWADRELEEGETLTDSLAWTIVPQEIEPDALMLVTASMNATTSQITLGGGRPGHIYHISHRVRTDQGRVLVRSALVRVVSA